MAMTGSTRDVTTVGLRNLAGRVHKDGNVTLIAGAMTAMAAMGMTTADSC